MTDLFDSPQGYDLHLANLKLTAAYQERDRLWRELSALDERINVLNFEQQDAYGAWFDANADDAEGEA